MDEDELKALANAAAAELHALAGDIDRTLDTLPKNTSHGTRELLQQHGRRCKAIAAALTVESTMPDPEVVDKLLITRRSVVKGVLAVLGVVGVGALEDAGAEIRRKAMESAQKIFDDRQGLDLVDLAPAVEVLDPAEGMRIMNGVASELYEIERQVFGDSSPLPEAEGWIQRGARLTGRIQTDIAEVLDEKYDTHVDVIANLHRLLNTVEDARGRIGE